MSQPLFVTRGNATLANIQEHGMTYSLVRLIFIVAGLLAPGLLHPAMTFAPPAQAEVRFGKNVRVGGHDFSNQRFNRQKRARIYLYRGKPTNPGCQWRTDGRGGRVRVCHLQRR